MWSQLKRRPEIPDDALLIFSDLDEVRASNRDPLSRHLGPKPPLIRSSWSSTARCPQPRHAAKGSFLPVFQGCGIQDLGLWIGCAKQVD